MRMVCTKVNIGVLCFVYNAREIERSMAFFTANGIYITTAATFTECHFPSILLPSSPLQQLLLSLAKDSVLLFPPQDWDIALLLTGIFSLRCAHTSVLWVILYVQ